MHDAFAGVGRGRPAASPPPPDRPNGPPSSLGLPESLEALLVLPARSRLEPDAVLAPFDRDVVAAPSAEPGASNAPSASPPPSVVGSTSTSPRRLAERAERAAARAATVRRALEESAFRAHETACAAFRLAARCVPTATLAALAPRIDADLARVDATPSAVEPSLPGRPPVDAPSAAATARGAAARAREASAIALVRVAHAGRVGAHRAMNAHRVETGLAPVPVHVAMPPDRAAFDRLLVAHGPATPSGERGRPSKARRLV